MFSYKEYKQKSTYPYYTFNIFTYINNNYLTYLELLFRRHIQYGIYGNIKYWFFKVLVFLKLKKPFEDWEVMEYYFDL